MEEILASIRRIISEDDAPAEPAAEAAPPPPEPEPEPAPASFDDDVLELTDPIAPEPELPPLETVGDIDVYSPPAPEPEPAYTPPPAAPVFDRDEVADPNLVVIDGVARVLYAGRRGTRWSIGSIVASPDFTHFAPVDVAPLLGPSASGFDALGVSEPLLVRRDDVDWLYFAGTDGARRGVGVARQDVLGGVR